MQKRPFGFIFGLALIFGGLMLFQQWMFPFRPVAKNPPAQAAADLTDTDAADGTASKTAVEEQDSSVQEQDLLVQDNRETVAPVPPRFYTLGSLDPDGSDRFLITLTSEGGCVYRVELNARDRQGRFRYRDLDHFGGFAGKMELSRAAGGLQVNLVGPGSPADSAGLQVGDLIRAVDGIPVVSATDFQRVISKGKVGQELVVSLTREASGNEPQEKTVSIELTDQPLELIQPEDGRKYPELVSRSSFATTLRKPVTDKQHWPVVDAEMARANWECSEIEIEGQRGIEFQWVIPGEKALEMGFPGSITMVKRYWLKKLAESERLDFSGRTFGIQFQLEIRTDSTEPFPVAMQLNGPNGLPTEGWWYQNKIHGKSTAIGSMAGARDVVGSTDVNPYRFWGTPEIVSEAKKGDAGRFLTLVDAPTSPTGKSSSVRFLGVDSQYFNVSLLPSLDPANPAAGFDCYSAFAAVASLEIPTNAKLHRLVDCTFWMFDRASISAESPWRKSFEIFAGPKEADLLAAYGLESNRTFGWFGWLSQFLCGTLQFLYWITGSFSYGLAIVLLTILVRSLMIPISRKAAINAQMMQHLAPEMKAIAEKHKDEIDKRSQAQRELFARHKYNPFGGCFLMFLQLPVFIGLYRGLSVDIALRDRPLIPGMPWCSNLAAPDQCYFWEDWMPAWLGSESGWLGPWLNILPIITIVLFLVQQKLFTPPATDDQQKFAQKMMTYMMVFMGVMFFRVPSGLCIYFITSSIWGIAERKMLPKPKLSADKIASITGETGVVVEPSGHAKPKKTRNGFGQGMMKRLRDQIEYGEQRPVQKQPDAETKRRMDRERKKKHRDNER